VQVFTRERLLHATLLTALVLLAWAAVAYASLGSSWGRLLNHEALLGARVVPLAAAIPLFVAAWVVMSAAMMLPTVWPVVDRFAHAARLQPLGAFVLLMALFVAGYLMVWGLFGLAAFAGDFAIHRLVEVWGLLQGPAEFIGGGVLLLAGAYQFSPLKRACLSQCQSPMGFLVRYWRPGWRGAIGLGLRHGLFCLGCCWALMLLMFGAGVTNLAWMVSLAVLFYLEKVTTRGLALSRAIGVLLLGFGALMLLGILPSPPSL
jgi:predicted metal-binding membrane protein